MIDSKKTALSGRSSLYCVWIRVNDVPDAPLVALWIDPQMRAFGHLGKEHHADAALFSDENHEIVDDSHLTVV